MNNQDLLASVGPSGYVFASRVGEHDSPRVRNLERRLAELEGNLITTKKTGEDAEHTVTEILDKLESVEHQSRVVAATALKVMSPMDVDLFYEVQRTSFTNANGLMILMSLLNERKYTSTVAGAVHYANNNNPDAIKFLASLPRLAVSRVTDKKLEIYFPAPDTDAHQRQIHSYLTQGTNMPNIKYILIPEKPCGITCTKLTNASYTHHHLKQRVQNDLAFLKHVDDDNDGWLRLNIDPEIKTFAEEKCMNGAVVTYTLDALTRVDESDSSFLDNDDLDVFIIHLKTSSL
jgi:hypothetical protein